MVERFFQEEDEEAVVEEEEERRLGRGGGGLRDDDGIWQAGDAVGGMKNGLVVREAETMFHLARL